MPLFGAMAHSVHPRRALQGWPRQAPLAPGQGGGRRLRTLSSKPLSWLWLRHRWYQESLGEFHADRRHLRRTMPRLSTPNHYHEILARRGQFVAVAFGDGAVLRIPSP